MIQFKDVSKTFKAKGVTTQALQHVSLDIEDGDMFGVIAMAVIMGAAFLAGCGSDNNNSANANKKELTYSKSQGPYSDLFEKGIKPILEKKAIKLQARTCLICYRLMSL